MKDLICRKCEKNLGKVDDTYIGVGICKDCYTLLTFKFDFENEESEV